MARFKRNERLYQIALRSHWTYSAKLAAGGIAIGVLFVPMALTGTENPELMPLAGTVQFLGWVFSLTFAGIAVYRYWLQRRGLDGDAADADSDAPSRPADKDDA